MKPLDLKIIAIVSEQPGISGAQIHQKLQERSRAAGWFKPGSFWLELFGPSVGGMYVSLMRLEEQGILSSWWGAPLVERGGRRPRLYSVNMSVANASPIS